MAYSLICSLADRENIHINSTNKPGLLRPYEGIPQWLDGLQAEQYSPRTIHEYHRTVRLYLKQDPTPTLLSIQKYLAERLACVSPARVAMERKALRSLFRFLRSSGLWLIDPTANLKPIKVRYKERQLPTNKDVAKLLNAKCYHHNQTPRFRLMVILLLDTGLRIQEACTIQIDNINLDRLEITVVGKESKERVVPICRATAGLLRAWLAANGHSKWLFPSTSNDRHWEIDGFERAIRRVCLRCNIKPITPHALRHFFATHNLKNGTRLEVISKILGHASTAITADTYVHIDRRDIHEAHRLCSPFAKLRLNRATQVCLPPAQY